jgi:hypothetical protein
MQSSLITMAMERALPDRESAREACHAT